MNRWILFTARSPAESSGRKGRTFRDSPHSGPHRNDPREPTTTIESRRAIEIIKTSRTQTNRPKIMNAPKNNKFIQPYLFFNGSCEQAVEFYRKALGAEVEMMMRYKESPEPHQPGMVPPGFENKIMHASFRIGQTTVMASDGCAAEKPNFEGFSLSLGVPN